MKRYRMRVNGLYVRSVSVFSTTIDLSVRDFNDPRYFTEQEKDLVLMYFPNAEVKQYSLVESKAF